MLVGGVVQFGLVGIVFGQVDYQVFEYWVFEEIIEGMFDYGVIGKIEILFWVVGVYV